MYRLAIFLLLSISTYSWSQEVNGRFQLKNLGRKVNTGYHEGAPVISADGKTLYFFVKNHPENSYGKDNSQDIWFSKLGPDGQWGEAERMSSPLNNNRSNQVFTVMPDGNTLLIMGGSSKNSPGFSLTSRTGNSWSKPEELKVQDFKKMNRGKFYGASMSSKGDVMVLYFSEKENSTFSDLYITKKQGDGWSRPVKLSSPVNTSRDEFGPFIAPDDKTVYFASNRKTEGSVGGMDIWKMTRLDNSWLKWSKPVNAGRPLNTRAFDSYMSVDDQGNIFTTQSGRTIDGGNLDIFQLIEKPINITLKGFVSDKKTGDGIGADIFLSLNGKPLDTLNAPNGEGTYNTKLTSEGNYTFSVTSRGYRSAEGALDLGVVMSDTVVFKDFALVPMERNALLSGTVYDEKTNQTLTALLEVTYERKDRLYRKKLDDGYYETELDEKGEYVITASAEGYINGTDRISYRGDQKLLTKDIYLKPIEIGATVRLNNIFFDFDKTTLKRESYVELDKVVDFLNSNLSVEIEIAGHTDNKGTDQYNLNLSQGRAQAVVDYLIDQGISTSRLVAKGYGESVPLKSNNTDAGRAYNRRVEFTVLKK